MINKAAIKQLRFNERHHEVIFSLAK